MHIPSDQQPKQHQHQHQHLPNRTEIIAACPGLQASPTQVRDWLAAYLRYRGLDAGGAARFFWRGVELHRATYGTLLEAFRQHCGMLEWEADILAYDIYTIIESSIPPPKRTIFQEYVEALFGYEFYSNLLLWTAKPNPGFLDRANCAFCWTGFFIIHAVLSLIVAVIVGFLYNTRLT
ncbi:hypothetical protein F4780DRAFT_77752 [Xylariomycetidae sp. FL0641]|nr:hypothetical protein F4780DRAFT_77752 [Xylariomycetidae sp. FL0641]